MPRAELGGEVSGSQIEQLVDELILFANISVADPPRLALADHVHRLVSINRSPGTKPDNKYREVLLACARAPKNELGRFSAMDVCKPYSEIRGMEMGITDYARHLSAFCKPERGSALVKTGEKKRYMYHFANPLLEPLVLMTASRADQS